MTDWPEPAALQAIQRRVQVQADRLRLIVHQPRGRAGAQLGAGVGSSVEYQDHRPFVLGDDPRHLDWNAYGRTGQWIAKVYRAEVTPVVDVAFDASRSMCADDDKALRALELLYLALEGGRRSAASVRVHVVVGEQVWTPDLDAVDAGAWLPEAPPAGTPHDPRLRRVRWRRGGTRVAISDLLFAGEPQRILHPLVEGAGRALLLVPFSAREASPDWQGNLMLEDVDSGLRRAQHVDEGIRQRYRAAYGVHFDGYAQAARRMGVRQARVEAAGALEASLRAEAVPAGLVEPWT